MCSPVFFFQAAKYVFCCSLTTWRSQCCVFMCVRLSLNCLAFAFHLMLQYQGLSPTQWLYFWMFFFNCQQMYYKWCHAAERLVVCTVLMAMTLLFFINVLLGKNKFNKVSWLSFGHLFPTRSLSAAWFFCGFLPGRFSSWENGDLVIMGIREIRGILSHRTWDCTYLQRFPLLVLLAAFKYPSSPWVLGLVVPEIFFSPSVEDKFGPACQY